MKRLLLAIGVLVSGTALAWAVFPPARERIQAWMPWLPAAMPEGPAPKAAAKKGPPPPPVTAATVVLADMPVTLSAPGTVEARATIAVKPRVDGQISTVEFKEGDLVKEGQVLFRFDDRLVRAQIKQAEANIKRDEATLADAQATYKRRTVLIEKKIVSEAAMDTAKSSVETLKAAIAAGQAALEAQKTQLDYLVVVAPITGRTGSSTIKPGANVRAADATPLVTINQTQPILVTFSVPQNDMPALRRSLAAKSAAEIRIPGDKPEIRQGTIEFIDNQVDKQTGTLAAKVLAANADEALWPGQAVEVVLNVEVRPGMLSVPASAVLPSQLGMLVWVIGSDQRVSPRPVVVERISGQTAFLASGVAAGDRVVTDGHVRIAPGALVAVQEPGGAKGQKKDKGGKGPEAGASRDQGGERGPDRGKADKRSSLDTRRI